MKISAMKISVFFALGLISCALFVQQAQAVPITGAITFAGGVELDSTTVNTATRVTGWLDEGGFMPTVQSVSGSFSSVAVGTTTIFTPTWSFNSGPIPLFWSVGGFTFNLIGSHIFFQGGGFLNVVGTGTIIGNGYNPTFGHWSFTVQDDASNGVFSFSGGTTVPDGGRTVALLGLALAVIEGIRRKLRNAKS